MHDVKSYKDDRRAALLSLDADRLRAFWRKWGDDLALPDMAKETFWAGVHLARLALADIPPEDYILSENWLVEHGWERCEGTAATPFGWRLVRP